LGFFVSFVNYFQKPFQRFSYKKLLPTKNINDIRHPVL
jgi:hypothetical protein